MSVQVLVVDDMPANVKLLEVRLKAERFGVLIAGSGPEALEICASGGVDVVLMDVRMPGMDGLSVCRHLKTDPVTRHIPVAIVTALDRASDRLKGIEAGADDFLVKPVDDISLITHVRNLGRLKALSAEMNKRQAAYNRHAAWEESDPAGAARCERGRILIIDSHSRRAQRLAHALAQHHVCKIEIAPHNALMLLQHERFDLAIVNLNIAGMDGLELCSQICTAREGGHLQSIVLVEPGDRTRLLRSLEIGVNDYLMCPFEQNDLLVRVRTQIKIKRYADFLNRAVQDALSYTRARIG